MTRPSLRVGLIGCGEVAQVVHIPTLGFMPEFRVVYLCDISQEALSHCKTRVFGGSAPKTTTDPTELCSSEEVDVVFVINSDEYHADHAILALQNDKHVFVEKPLALNLRDIERLKSAEASSKGKVMVGYMRRYATAFVDAVKEIGGLDQILYARVRDIIGPNSAFVNQSGTFPRKFTDFRAKESDEKDAKAKELVAQALEVECEVPVDERSTLMWRILGGLGTHDLSAMREALGMPTKVLGVHPGWPFWNVLFQFPGFAVSYESGIDEISRFDAHIEVYGRQKNILIQYDTPYIKGLPIKLHIRENVDSSYRETTILKTYEDPYVLEMRELYAWFVEDKPIKTTIEDAEKDIRIFQSIMKAGFNDI